MGKYPELEDSSRLKELLTKHGSRRKVAKAVGCSHTTVNRWIEKHGIEYKDQAQSVEPNELLSKLKKPITEEELAETLNTTPENIEINLDLLRGRGFEIATVRAEDGQDGVRYVLDRETVPSEARVSFPDTVKERVRIGVVSDIHYGSFEQQKTYLEDIYDRFQDAGVKHVYNGGDMVTGVGVYRGQHAEIFLHTYDEQVDYTVENYPRREGITTHAIGGNHDLVFKKFIGADPLKAITDRRDDIEYLGQYSAWVELTPNFTLYLIHPAGAQAYAVSYKLQKLVESFEGGRKPNLVIAGHWHQMGYFMARNVHALYPGCFEAQTEFERRKALQPQIGGLILDIELDDNGAIHEFAPRFIRYFKPRERDW